MDNKEYLRQIAASSTQPKTPVQQAKSGAANFFSSIYFKLIAGAAAAFMLIAILGSILGSGGDSLKENSISLKLHLDYVANTIGNYQKLVKSSDLRSSSASLTSIISNTNRDLTNFLAAKYAYKDNDAKKTYPKIFEEQQLQFSEREQVLFNAKINGALDRYYAHQMAYEITYITTKEAAIIKAAKDQTLISSLNSSISSLNNLYSKFNDFSEAK